MSNTGTTEILMALAGSITNIIIPALIFIFMNYKMFISKDITENDPKSRKLRRKKIRRLIIVSPIGFLLILLAVLIMLEMVTGAFLLALGVIDFSNDSAFTPTLSITGLSMEFGNMGSGNDSMLLIMLAAALISVPVLILVIKAYCKIINSSARLAVFVYMAVLYMYVTATLITIPLNDLSPTFAGIISTGSFIVMLLIFYQSAAEKIEFMRQNENSELTRQINTLPCIIFILLIILLGLEIMLEKNGYLDMAYYLIILSFALILYTVSQLAYHILFRHIEERRQIEELSRQSLEAQEQVTLAFAEITEAKSGQTGRHVKRVSEYSRILAEALELAPDEVETIRIASMMHDIGKLLISPEILEKMGGLTDEEFEIMKTHVIIGENLLHNAPGKIMETAKVIAQQHHEKWNGKGYLGMAGEDIALSARITAVADVYDALTSKRSYKKAWTSQEAFEKIICDSGQHFDPKIVEAFKSRFEEIKDIQEEYADSQDDKDTLSILKP